MISPRSLKCVANGRGSLRNGVFISIQMFQEYSCGEGVAYPATLCSHGGLEFCCARPPALPGMMHYLIQHEMMGCHLGEVDAYIDVDIDIDIDSLVALP